MTSRSPLPRIVLAFLVLALCLAAGCGPDEEPAARVDLAKRQEPAPPDTGADLTYAYLPQYSNAVSFLRHHRIVEYLQNATGLTVRQVFPSSFDDHMAMFGQGKIDISYTNPFVYIKIARRNGARAFARIIEPGGPPDGSFGGQIIARRDNAAIDTLDDCRGKRWIATDPSSAGGYLFPLGLFIKNGIRPKDFAEVSFAGGNQERVVYAVYSGEYDIGAIRTGTLDIVRGRIPVNEIKVVAESPSYPAWVFAARGGLDPAVVARVQAALTDLDPAYPSEQEILAAASIERIIPATDADFDSVRELIDTIGEDVLR